MKLCSQVVPIWIVFSVEPIGDFYKITRGHQTNFCLTIRKFFLERDILECDSV